jgi:hypothetical protein
MMRFAKLFSAFFFLFFCIQTTSAQCPPGQDSVRLEIESKDNFDEVSWEIYEKSDPSMVYASGVLTSDSLQVFNYCIPQGDCKVLSMKDSYGDGMFPTGVYRLYVNGVLKRLSIGYYGAGQITEFGCPLGTACNNALPMTLGSGTTPDGSEAWYSYTPPESGVYSISTCGAVCPAKIWVYDRCNGIVISENVVGSVFYADDGCPDGSAFASALLEAQKEYFIRIRYADILCSSEPVPYTLTFVGIIEGCMDPAACNYEPLATVSSGECLYPGNPDCPQAPDIAIDQELLVNTMIFDNQFSNNPCLVDEGCLRGFGNRNVIKFDTRITNVGNSDFYIGPPPPANNPGAISDQFVYDACHGHWHYLGYAEYILFNSAGKRIPIGSKIGICLLDVQCPDQNDKKYLCNNMGLTASCSDIYDHVNTACQWIDITDIPADDYTMVARVNWLQRPDKIGRVEKTFDNNWAQACFRLTYDGGAPEVEFKQDSCQQFTDCSGVLFGSAQPDCNGVCNGTALTGDWNLDTLRNTADVEAYLQAALSSEGDATPCSDLHEDGTINVFDAALLQECTFYEDSVHHWAQRFPCQFPTGVFNPQDFVTIQIAEVDTVDKSILLEIVNPFHPIIAYEFSLSGLVIDSLENLSAEFNATPEFNAGTGKIIALAAPETSLEKNSLPAAFLRVHYAALTAPEVCISEITAVVNHKYQRSSANIGNPACIPVTFVGTKDPLNAPFVVFVQPNPMHDQTTVFFENKNAEPMTFTLSDLTGRVLRTQTDLRGESVLLERADLPQGTYIFTLRSSRGSVSGKVVMW